MPTYAKKHSRLRNILLILALTAVICFVVSGCKVMTSSGESVSIFSLILVRPFAWVLRWLNEWVKNFGLALVLFTIFTRLILLPLNIKSKRSMLEIQLLQPKLKAIEAKYKNDKEKMQEEQMKLYKQEGVSPMSGCLPSLIMLPLMFALYWPISQPLRYLMQLTVEQIAMVRETLIGIGATVGNVAISSTTSEMALVQAINENFAAVSGISENIFKINLNFLGMNLGGSPNFRVFDALFFLPIISAVTAFLSMKVTSWIQKKSNGGVAPASGKQGETMTWMMPLISLWIGYTLPAGLAVYWIIGNVISIAQEFLITYILKKQKEKAPLKEVKKLNDKNSGEKRKN